MDQHVDTLRTIETPEGVVLTLRVAGPVPRSLAWSIDLVVRRSRALALREEAHRSLPLVYGFAGMLLIAAFIEAFWSPRHLPTEVKFAAGALLWAAVGAYLLLAGRGR